MKHLQLAPVVVVLALPFLLGLGLPSHAQEGPTTALLDGIVIPKRQVKLTPLVDGRLTGLRVEEGTRVEEGQRLAEIEDSLARASVDAARAQAERTADHVKATFARDMADRRLRRLVAAEEAVSELEIEQARAALVEAEATLAAVEEVRTQSEKNLLVELVRLENHYVRAPFDGEITRVQANVGATLTSASEFLTLVDLSSLVTEIHLPVSYYGRLREGQVYRLLAAEPVERALEGVLTYVDPWIDSASRTFRCVLEIDNADGRLPAGFTVQLELDS